MRKHIQSIKAAKSGRKVTNFEMEWPRDAEAWIEESGYNEFDLLQFAFEGWIVKEGAPEVRASLEKGTLTVTKAAQILEARVKAGWRERKASPKEQKLRASGVSEAEIEVWKKLNQLTK